MPKFAPKNTTFVAPSGHFHRWVRRGELTGCFQCRMILGSHGLAQSREGKLYMQKVAHMLGKHCPDGGDQNRHVKEYPFECIGPTNWPLVRAARKWRGAFRKVKLINTLLHHGQEVGKRLAKKRLREAVASRSGV